MKTIITRKDKKLAKVAHERRIRLNQKHKEYDKVKPKSYFDEIYSDDTSCRISSIYNSVFCKGEL